MPTPSTLSGGALSAWKSAHDAALNGTCKNSGARKGECAARVGWAAVKKGWVKKGDSWVRKAKEARTDDRTDIEAQVHDIFPVQEAVFNDEAMEADLVIIREGLNKSRPRKNYTKASLQQAVKEGIFNNMKMFVDHSNKPPLKRSVREMVSGTGITEYREGTDGKGSIIAPASKFFDEQFYKFAKQASGHMGVSIDALVKGVRFRGLDGQVQEDIHSFVKGNSVDWVAFPSAGGGIERFLTAQEGVDVADVDWETLTPDMVQEHAPDLYQAIIDRAPKPTKESEPPDDGGEGDGDEGDEFIKLTQSQFDAKVQESVSAAVTAIETKSAKRASTARSVAALVDSAALPATTKVRVKASFDGAEEFSEEAVKEAISGAQKELQEAGAKPHVIGMGVTRSADDGKEFVGPAQEAVLVAMGIDPSNTGKKEN